MNQHVTIAARDFTLADVLAATEGAQDLSETRRRDLRSDITAIARWLDRSPASIVADASALRPLLENLHHVQMGVSKKRVQNAISNLKAALKIASAPPASRRRTPFRTPAWKERLASCPTEWDRHRLAGLATFFSEQGIDEGDVDDAIIVAYREHLRRENLRKDTGGAFRLAIYSWNKLIDQRIATHLNRLTPPRSDKNWANPLSEFPDAFQADLDQWLARSMNVDLFAESGPKRALRPHSIENIRVAVRHAASALVMTGTPIGAITSLSVLTQLGNFKTILRFFIDRNGTKAPTWLSGLASKLVAIARYHVKLDAEELEPLLALKSRVKISREGLTEKNKTRLGQFDDPRNAALLVRLPKATATRVDARTEPSRWDALDVMCALAVDILLAVPMRVGNLATLNAERHITWRGHGAGRYAALMIPGDEVKNGTAIEADLPKETSRLLRTYIDRYRPIVSDYPGDWLFPKASGGGNRRPGGLSHQIFCFIQREIGLEVNAHLFRHLAGMLYLMRFPGHYEVVRRMLGHKTVTTTIAFYTSIESKWALKRYDETVLSQWRSDDGV